MKLPLKLQFHYLVKYQLITSTFDISNGVTDEVNLYHRDNLEIGRKLSGPAVIVEQTSTTFLESNWVAEVVEMGNLQLNKEL